MSKVAVRLNGQRLWCLDAWIDRVTQWAQVLIDDPSGWKLEGLRTPPLELERGRLLVSHQVGTDTFLNWRDEGGTWRRVECWQAVERVRFGYRIIQATSVAPGAGAEALAWGVYYRQIIALKELPPDWYKL